MRALPAPFLCMHKLDDVRRYTSKLRPHDAGFLITGSLTFAIPPAAAKYTVYGNAEAACCSSRMPTDIHILASTPHMHLLGRASTLNLWSGDTKRNLFTQKAYDYNTPQRFDLADQNIILKRGDWLETTCTFDSRQRTNYTRFGEATDAEMCLAFILHYPVSSVSRCISVDEEYLGSPLRDVGELDAYVALPPAMRAIVGPEKGVCGPAGVVVSVPQNDVTPSAAPTQALIGASTITKVAVSAAATSGSLVRIACLIGLALCLPFTTSG